jgi:hypothetical protein
MPDMTTPTPNLPREKMHRKSKQSESSPSPFSDCGVDRETLTKFFHPPIGKTTFYDMVNRGIILPITGVRGYFRLNDSLRRMGLREVKAPPSNPHCSEVDYLRMAFNTIDKRIFPEPPCSLDWEPLPQDLSHIKFLADLHRKHIEQWGSIEEKVGYANGAVDATYDLSSPDL